VLAANILQGIGILLEVLTFVVLIRVLISWIPGLNPYHPMVRLIRAIADPILAPFRGLLPSFGGMLDISPVLAIIVLQVVAEVCFALAHDVALTGVSIGAILVAALEQLILTLIIIVAVLVLLRFVLSLFHADPWHPLTRAIRAMAQPFVRPFDGMVTHSSSIDVEALIAFVAYLLVFFVARLALDGLVGLL
jgi:YggT family protein